MQFPQKIKYGITVPHDKVTLLLDTYLKKMKTLI